MVKFLKGFSGKVEVGVWEAAEVEVGVWHGKTPPPGHLIFTPEGGWQWENIPKNSPLFEVELFKFELV